MTTFWIVKNQINSDSELSPWEEFPSCSLFLVCSRLFSPWLCGEMPVMLGHLWKISIKVSCNIIIFRCLLQFWVSWLLFRQLWAFIPQGNSKTLLEMSQILLIWVHREDLYFRWLTFCWRLRHFRFSYSAQFGFWYSIMVQQLGLKIITIWKMKDKDTQSQAIPITNKILSSPTSKFTSSP